jgi:hypothetical protein
MVLALLLGSYYSIWVSILTGLVHVFTLLSLLVSADRILNVIKYCFIRARSRLTGHIPQHDWNFKPLSEDPHEFPKVRALAARLWPPERKSCVLKTPGVGPLHAGSTRAACKPLHALFPCLTNPCFSMLTLF